jgi:hypothetical protein
MAKTSIALLAIACATLLANKSIADNIPVANHSFQLPDPGGDGNADDEDAYDLANANPLPPNWTFVNTANDNFGQQRPDPQTHFTRDVTGGEFSPFTQGGFDGDLVLFANMNSPGETLTATSDVVGQIETGIYVVTVGVGGRDTGSWNDIDYTVGLVGSVSGVLGTSSVRINPGDSTTNSASSSFTTDEYNVVDLSFSLDVLPGSSLIGEELSVQIIAANSGFRNGDPVTSGFTQAAIDNVRLQLVPEPASIVLASTWAALAVGMFRRCRKS